MVYPYCCDYDWNINSGAFVGTRRGAPCFGTLFSCLSVGKDYRYAGNIDLFFNKIHSEYEIPFKKEDLEYIILKISSIIDNVTLSEEDDDRFKISFNFENKPYMYIKFACTFFRHIWEEHYDGVRGMCTILLDTINFCRKHEDVNFWEVLQFMYSLSYTESLHSFIDIGKDELISGVKTEKRLIQDIYSDISGINHGIFNINIKAATTNEISLFEKDPISLFNNLTKIE